MKLPPRIAFSAPSAGRSGDVRTSPAPTMRMMLWGAPGRSTSTRRGSGGNDGVGRDAGIARGSQAPNACSSRPGSVAVSKSPDITSVALLGRQICS